MEIFITHENEKTGPFSPQEIQAGLASGKYQYSDLIWFQGIKAWTPLSQATGIFSTNPAVKPILKPVTSGYRSACWILGILIVLFFFGILLPFYDGQILSGRKTEAVVNSKSIGFALSTFEVRYGSYPNAETAKLLAEEFSTPDIQGESSNARFRQLIVSGDISDEFIFYVKSSTSKEPDGNISGKNAIAPGECSFGYIDNIPSNITDSRPLLMTPFIAGTNKFDPKPFDNRIFVFWTEGRVSMLKIDPSTGKALLRGQDILDPIHSIWGGTEPRLLIPEGK
jgi:GYF domain 2